jgi:hypothetical protein
MSIVVPKNKPSFLGQGESSAGILGKSSDIGANPQIPFYDLITSDSKCLDPELRWLASKNGLCVQKASVVGAARRKMKPWARSGGGKTEERRKP